MTEVNEEQEREARERRKEAEVLKYCKCYRVDFGCNDCEYNDKCDNILLIMNFHAQIEEAKKEAYEEGHSEGYEEAVEDLT